MGFDEYNFDNVVDDLRYNIQECIDYYRNTDNDKPKNYTTFMLFLQILKHEHGVEDPSNVEIMNFKKKPCKTKEKQALQDNVIDLSEYL